MENPWDNNSTLDPSEWAPYDFHIEDLSLRQKKLTWTYGNHSIEGFYIDRKTGTDNWQHKFQILSKEARSFVDDQITPGISDQYYYRICAFAGNQTSLYDTASVSICFDSPTELQILPNSITTVSLQWNDNSEGEEGFIIERSYDGSNWNEIGRSNTPLFSDNKFQLNSKIYYRVCAYYNQFVTNYASNSFNSYIPVPENFKIINNSIHLLELRWDYSFYGHQGFIIDKKTDNNNWMIDYVVLDNPVRLYLDTDINLENHIYTYRISTFVEDSKSDYVEESIKLSIGMIAHGGIVFYLDDNGGGLVCPTIDQHSSKNYGCQDITLGTNTEIGSGAANTILMLPCSNTNNDAAIFCENLVLNGYDDWFLPSIDELSTMITELQYMENSNFYDDKYLSSSEATSFYALVFDRNFGGASWAPKSFGYRIRVVRAF